MQNRKRKVLDLEMDGSDFVGGQDDGAAEDGSKTQVQRCLLQVL